MWGWPQRVFDFRLKNIDINTKSLRGLQNVFRTKEKNQDYFKERQSDSIGEIWLVSRAIWIILQWAGQGDRKLPFGGRKGQETQIGHKCIKFTEPVHWVNINSWGKEETKHLWKF